MSEFALPDAIVRESEMAKMLPILAKMAGVAGIPAMPEPNTAERFFPLQDVYDDAVEQAVRDAYGKDYTMFGFSNWQ